MICKHCFAAGMAFSAGYPDIAATQHGNCPGRVRHRTLCDCQHDTSQSALNQERLRELAAQPEQETTEAQ